MRIQILTDRHQQDLNPHHSNVDIQICRNIDALNHCATAVTYRAWSSTWTPYWPSVTVTIIVVFFIFIQSPLGLDSFHFLNFSISCYRSSATKTRSSAYNIFCGHPDLNKHGNASSTIMNRTEHWWTATFTANSSLSVLTLKTTSCILVHSLHNPYEPLFNTSLVHFPQHYIL